MINENEEMVWTEVPDAGVAEIQAVVNLMQFYPGVFQLRHEFDGTLLVGTVDTMTAILLAMRLNSLKRKRAHLEACYRAPAAECIEF